MFVNVTGTKHLHLLSLILFYYPFLFYGLSFFLSRFCEVNSNLMVDILLFKNNADCCVGKLNKKKKIRKGLRRIVYFVIVWSAFECQWFIIFIAICQIERNLMLPTFTRNWAYNLDLLGLLLLLAWNNSKWDLVVFSVFILFNDNKKNNFVSNFF